LREGVWVGSGLLVLSVESLLELGSEVRAWVLGVVESGLGLVEEGVPELELVEVVLEPVSVWVFWEE
jgi:hypothetical protein